MASHLAPLLKNAEGLKRINDFEGVPNEPPENPAILEIVLNRYGDFPECFGGNPKRHHSFTTWSCNVLYHVVPCLAPLPKKEERTERTEREERKEEKEKKNKKGRKIEEKGKGDC